MALPKLRAALPWGLSASLLAHAAVVLLLVLSTIPQREAPAAIDEDSVDVELFTPQQFAAMTQPGPVEATPSAPAAAPSSTPPDPEKTEPPQEAPSERMIRATTLHSAHVLAHPRSREAREAMRHLAEDERLEQLCGVEAMSQIHAWNKAFEPDRVSAFAMRDTKWSGATLIAEGAAFRSKKRWFNLRFSCGLSADHTQVAAFEFRVGDPIPVSQWRARNLPGAY